MIPTVRLPASMLPLALAGCALFGAPPPPESAPAQPAAADPVGIVATDLEVFTDEHERSGYRAPDGTVVLAPVYNHAAPFNEHGIAAVHQDRAWWWIDVRGERILRAYPYDNGADYASEGLARFVSDDGKVGYADATATVKIPARFDFATPFQDGLAAFCDGCTPQDDHGHSMMKGGQWGLIARDGEVVVAADLDAISSWTATVVRGERAGAPIEAAIVR